MRVLRASRKEAGPVILPKRVVRYLRTAGINPARLGIAQAVSMSKYRDLDGTLDAKIQRIEWQSGGIKMLHDEIATLKAKMETIVAQDLFLEERVVALSYAVAELQAESLVDRGVTLEKATT